MKNNLLLPFLLVLVIVLVCLLIIAIIFYLYTTAKTRERLALIEKGMDPNLSRSDFWPHAGIIAGGFGTGLFVSDLMPYFRAGLLLAIIFPVAGIIIYNIIVRRSRITR